MPKQKVDYLITIETKPEDEHKSCVYQLNIGSRIYVGSTFKRFKKRMQEHGRLISNYIEHDRVDYRSHYYYYIYNYLLYNQDIRTVTVDILYEYAGESAEELREIEEEFRHEICRDGRCLNRDYIGGLHSPDAWKLDRLD